MKQIYILILILFLMPGTGLSGQGKNKRLKATTETAVSDSSAYELLIFDTGFDAWLATKPSMNFYSQSYYESRNRMYVLEWNSRYMSQPRKGPAYETMIAYDPKIDYGLELNYRLFYYFKYFEETNKVKLINVIR